jgi:tetratricopeptide (TPR) repeat protein
MRRRVAAALVAIAAGVALPAAAPLPADLYLGLVTAYAGGDRAGAVDGVGRLDAAAIRFGLASVRDRPSQLARAALMLHTDRHLLERLVPRGDGRTGLKVECRETPHAKHALQAAQVLMLREDGQDFARRWFTTMALQDHLDECIEEALRWNDAAVERFPRDAETLLTRGVLYEAQAARQPRVPRALPPGGTEERRRHLAAVAARSDRLEEARRALAGAVAADPSLDEARVRLGHVLWSLGKGEDARAPLEVAIARTREPTVRHLARMFLGRIHQDAGRDDGALQQYRAALALQPTSQGAAIALADALQRAGRTEDARETVEKALSVAGRRQLPQSLWEYDGGSARLAPDRLQKLREETRS